ncbi:MAG: MXAN_5187 C-terminal domain-containing protein [Verrucomicrobiota bacterium]
MDDLKVTLDRMETELDALKHQYDLFFQGGRRSEPAKERRELELRILALSRRSIVNGADQLRFNNLQGKYWSFANLWTRNVRDLEEGRLRRDASGAITRQGIDRKEPADTGHIERVAKELLEARRSCGLAEGGAAELAALREKLLDRAREISATSGGKNVEFRVSVENGKPKVKATLR